MMYFVLGKPNSGKSLRAEEIAVSSGSEHLLYVATMKVMDEAGEARVKKHRKQREGKGFETVELPCGLSKLLPQIEEPGKTTVLLECLSNLVGNEIYDNPERENLRNFVKTGRMVETEDSARRNADLISQEISKNEEAVLAEETALAEEITREIRELAGKVQCLVVVSTEYELNDEFDEETKNYIRILNLVNEKIKAISDRVIT